MCVCVRGGGGACCVCMCVGRVGVDREREREQVNRKRKLYTVSSLRETQRRTKTEARVETTMAADPASSSAELGPEDSLITKACSDRCVCLRWV